MDFHCLKFNAIDVISIENEGLERLNTFKIFASNRATIAFLDAIIVLLDRAIKTKRLNNL